MSKRILILTAVALVSLIFWIVTKPWVTDPTWSVVNYTTWLWPLVMLMITGAVVASALALLDDHWYRLGVSAIIGGMFLALFGITITNLVSLLALFTFHFLAIRGIRQAVHNHLKVDFRSAVMHGMRFVIMPLLIMISFAYFANPDVQASAQQNRLPASITRAVESASKLVVRAELASVSESQRVQIERRLQNEVLTILNREMRPFRQYFPPLLAFGLFLVLQGLSFIFIPLAGYMAWGLFSMLRTTGFVTIAEKDVKAEVLSL